MVLDSHRSTMRGRRYRRYSEIGVTSTGTKHLSPTPRQKMCFDSTLPVEHSFQSTYYVQIKEQNCWHILILIGSLPSQILC